MLLLPRMAVAQDLFEIQVYPSETAEPRHTWLELHMIAFPKGTQDTADGVYPNNRQFHLTAEITHGLTKNFEVAAYIVTAVVPDEGARYAGTRIRGRFQVPSIRRMPFRISLSTEVDFNKHQFDPNGITLELRPILDRNLGRWYFALNPSLTKSLKGRDAHGGFGFEPSLKISYGFTRHVSAGLEYYGETGPVTHFDSIHDQHHVVFPALDISISPEWELNFGIGRGLTGTSEHWIVKCILGHRFGF